MKKKVIVVKKSGAKKVYRFNPVGDRDGKPSPYHHEFKDDQDFTVNPTLIKQIGWENCHEATPEGKALWLYMRLCQLFKYDEGIFFSDHRNHPNDDPYRSFLVARETTVNTPTTCFNFSRIAVKLLNQIEGVHALMIAVGVNHGHFRFGYYTDQVTVDAEPTSPHHHYNDMARVKLGLAPVGLKVFHGQALMQALEARIIPAMLPKLTPDLKTQIAWIEDETKLPDREQIKLRPLVESLHKNQIDGATTLQVLIDLNKHYAEAPYKMMRAGIVNDKTVEPQLLIRKQNNLARVDLNKVELLNLPVPTFDYAFGHGEMIYANDDIEQYLDFVIGLSTTNDCEIK
ncbi:MAG: hypothetical protein J5580_00080 [Clostridia bacterium]|nr:hypothetical protein [Clostridia bacterium]